MSWAFPILHLLPDILTRPLLWVARVTEMDKRRPNARSPQQQKSEDLVYMGH